MARSIKSKRGMALRRIKRERYAKKELIRLNNMLGIPNKEDKPEDVEMASDDDKKKGMSSKDYRLLKKVVKDGSDSDASDVGKTFEEVMVMTSSKFLRKTCEAKLHNENKRQVEKSQSTAEATSNGDMSINEISVHDNEKITQKRDAAGLVNDSGNYPKWMNQKKIQALAKINRSLKIKRNKRLARAQLKSKKHMKSKVDVVSNDDSDWEDYDPSEEKTASDLVMETDDITTKATVEPPKAKGKKVKKVKKAAAKPKIAEKMQTRQTLKRKQPTEDPNSENVLTIDLSD